MATSRSKKKTLAESHQRALRAVEVTETTPGPILHDFAVLLRYVQENTVELSKTGLLPIRDLHSLNEAMHRPLPIGLVRPLLHCCPNIQGLYMLLRATALARVENKGRKRILKPDDRALANWEALNETERYMYLLRVWLLWADARAIQAQCPTNRPFALSYQYLLELIAAQAKWDARAFTAYLSYNPCLFNVALAGMFGLVDIVHEPRRKGSGWGIRNIRATPFGRAFLALAEQGMPRIFSWLPLSREGAWFEYWRDCVAPLFPQLQRDLTLPEPEKATGTYILTVHIGDVWRQFSVPAACRLEALANAILDAFDFDCDHLYEFLIEDSHGALRRYCHRAMDLPHSAHETAVGIFGLQPGQGFRFHYDFGDDWWFGIVLDRIEAGTGRRTKVREVDRHGEAPPQYECEEWEEEEWDDAPDEDEDE